jgi:hypothetical protein
VTIGVTGYDTYGNDWRQAPQDDLVLALAIGIYVANPTDGHQSQLSMPAERLPALNRNPRTGVPMPAWQQRHLRRVLKR